MGLHQPAPKKTDRRPYVALALALVLVVGIGWCSSEEDPPESAGPSVVFVPTPESEPEQPVVATAAPADASIPIEDSGAVAQVMDAGRPGPRRAPDLEDYMRRWRAALEPLFRHHKYPGAPTVLKAMSKEPPPEEQGPDGGLPPCEPTVQRLSLQDSKFDLVIVVDTSGSMYRALPKIADWLGALEKQIVDSRSDTQLLVVAKQVDLMRRKADGGFNLRVGSSDAIEVLLDGAKPGLTRWIDALRTGAGLQIVVVTDDESLGRPDDLLARLQATLGGTPFSVSLLGGLDTPGHAVLEANELLSTSTCAGPDGVRGLQFGGVYQELARATGGLRAPICHFQSRQAFTDALLKTRSVSGSTSCGWLLDTSRHRVDRVNALGLLHAPTPLLHERVASNCYGTRRSYKLNEKLLVLCESTCVELRKDGFDSLEVRLECNE